LNDLLVQIFGRDVRAARKSSMAHKLTRLEDDAVVVMTHTGLVEPEDIQKSLPDMLHAIGKHKPRGVIIDVRAADVQLPAETVIDNVVTFAQMVPQDLRVALVVVEGKAVLASALMTMIGQGRGLQVGEFAELEKAMGWITLPADVAIARGCIPLTPTD
jgi:hypothetical protein